MKKASIKFSIFSLILVFLATGSGSAMIGKNPFKKKQATVPAVAATSTKNTLGWDINGHRIRIAPEKSPLNDKGSLDQQIISFNAYQIKECADIRLAQKEKSDSLTEAATLPIQEKLQNLCSKSEPSEELAVILSSAKKTIKELETSEDSFLDKIGKDLRISRQRQVESSNRVQRNHEQAIQTIKNIQIKSIEFAVEEAEEPSDITIKTEKKPRIHLIKASVVMIGLVVIGIIVWLLVRKGSSFANKTDTLVKIKIDPRCLSLDNQVKTCITNAGTIKELVPCQTTIIKLAHDCKFSELATKKALSSVDFAAAQIAQTKREGKSFIFNEESKRLYNDLIICVKMAPSKIHAIRCARKFINYYANPKKLPNFDENLFSAINQAIKDLLLQIWHK